MVDGNTVTLVPAVAVMAMDQRAGAASLATATAATPLRFVALDFKTADDCRGNACALSDVIECAPRSAACFLALDIAVLWWKMGPCDG